MKKTGFIPKLDYQKYIKPLIKKYGFDTKNYTYFKLEDYRIEFIDDNIHYQREYFFINIVKNNNPIKLYRGYNTIDFVAAIEKEMFYYTRKQKISKLLNI